MEDDEFRRGEIEIQWLERRLPQLLSVPSRDAEVRVAAIAAALIAARDRAGRALSPPNGDAAGRSTDTYTNGARMDGWKHTARREGIRE
jgi:hypothetical protein